MRRRTSAGSARPFHAYSADCTTRNTARPQANDITMNSGGSSARAVGLPGDEEREDRAGAGGQHDAPDEGGEPDAGREWTFIRRSISVHR